MRSHTPAFIALALAAVVASAGDSEAASFTVRSTPCKGYLKQDKKWVPMDDLPLMKGERIDASTVSGRSDIVYWKQGSAEYSVPLTCLAAAGAAVPAQSSARPTTPGSAKAAGRARASWNLQLSAMSWQETISLTASNDRTYSLYGTHVGGCVGGGHRRSLSTSFDFAVDACAIYMMSALGDLSDEINYDATYASVIGIKTQLGALWHTDSQFFSLGVSAPLVYRSGNWPTPPETEGITYTLGNTSTLLTGITLESRLQPGNFLIIPRVGFLGSLSNFLWEIGFGYSL